jgi:hypothetical protein
LLYSAAVLTGKNLKDEIGRTLEKIFNLLLLFLSFWTFTDFKNHENLLREVIIFSLTLRVRMIKI